MSRPTPRALRRLVPEKLENLRHSDHHPPLAVVSALSRSYCVTSGSANTGQSSRRELKPVGPEVPSLSSFSHAPNRLLNGAFCSGSSGSGAIGLGARGDGAGCVP
jgi:hypothetical protein